MQTPCKLFMVQFLEKGMCIPCSKKKCVLREDWQIKSTFQYFPITLLWKLFYVMITGDGQLLKCKTGK